MLLPTHPIWISTVTSSFSAVSKTLFFFISSAFFPLSCNDNNDMTYKWPNSSFFNFQENANQENCRQYSCIIFFNWQIATKNLTKRKNYCWTKFFHKLDNNKCKYTRAHVQENKSIYLSIYLSIWKPFWKRVYICIIVVVTG